MIDITRLKQVYATLQKGGYSQDFGTFRKGFAGNENYANRKKVYDLLSANGAQIGKTYEEFMQNMQKPKSMGNPTVNKYRQQMFNSVDPTKNKASELTRKAVKTAHKSMDNVRKPVRGAVVNKQGKKVKEFDITPAKTIDDLNREYAQEVTSDWEKEQQRQSLYNTTRSLDEVQRKIAERDAQLDEADNGFWTGIRHAAQGMNVTGGIFQQYDDDMRKELIAPKYKQYLVEANYLTQMKKQLIQEEEDAAAPNATKWDKFKHASSSFTSGMLDEAFGSDAFDFGGYNKMRESDVLLRINDRINRGVATDDDRRLLQILKDKEEVESRLDNDAYSFGRGASQSAGFVTDFLITGGGDFGGLGRLGGKMALGLARKTFAKTMTKDLGKRFAAWSLKNLGKTLGEATGAAMTATSVQVGKTAANATQRYLGLDSDDGGLEYDKEGNLRFKGGTDVGTAIAKAVASGTIENYTELLGPHITSMGKRLFGWAGVGLEKITPDALSRFFDKVGSSELFKRIGTFTDEIANSKVLNAGKKSLAKVGVNDMPEEGLEEEAGIILNSLITGDNKFSDLWDKETQYKTWGGVMSMMGAMRAIPIARSAVGTAYSASKNKVEYFKCKHDLTKAETLARQALGDKWTPIKELIDNADNKHIIEVGVNIIRQSDKYSQEQAKAAQMYIGQLLKMRGFNNATMASIRDKNAKGEELTDADKKDIEVSNAYAEGHEAEGELRHLIQLEYEKRTANLAKRLGLTPEKIDAMNVDSFSSYIGLNSDADFDIFQYKKAKAAYDGVMDNAQNLVDIAGEVAAHRVDNMTNVHDGTIRKAFKKGTESNPDSPVYIISGNIELNDDVSINYTDSDKMIVVYDEETGQREAIGNFMLASVDPNIQNAEEVKAQAIQEAKQKIITEQSNVIDGILAEGSEFTMESNDGISHNYKIVQVDEQGNCIVSVDGTVLPEPLSLDAIQRQYDQSNIARSVKNDQTAQESEQTTQEPEQIQQEYQPIEDKFDYAKITNVNDGKVKSVVVTDEEGNNRFPNAKAVFLIQDKGAMPKFVVMDEEGNLTSYVGKRGDKIRLMGEKTVGEYKKQRQEELQMIAAENANSSMIEDNSGTIEGDRGEIEVEDNTQPLSEADADNVIAQMESSAEVAPELELTPDNWVVEFGEDGIVSTPIGDVKMGENQVAKLFEKGRSKEFGMIKPTLTNPDVIIEVPSHSADGNEERSSSYLFIKTFLGKNGEKVYYFKSVTIKKDGLEISISSHYDRAKRVKEALMEGKLLYRKNDGAQTEQNQPSASVTTSQEDAAGSSENKDTNISANGNENNESLTFEDGTPIPVDANGETDLSQTDAAHAAEWYDNNLGEDADDWLDGEIKKVKKVLEQAKNKKLAGTKPSELVASKKEKEAAIADAQAHYDSAISIRDSLKERRIAKEENTADGRKNLIEKARRKFSRLKSAVKDDAEAVSQLYKDVVGSLLHRLYDVTGIDVTDTIPLTAEEYVASNLGAHSLNYEGTETSKGVKQETGLSREDFAKTQLLAADGKGTTIDDLVHSLWENRPSNLESLDTQDIRNALIGVLNSGFKASEARNYIENLRIAQAENILEEQKKAAANAAFSEENKAESEQQTETAPESEEKTEVDNSDEINDEENEKINAPEQNKFPDKLRDGSKAIEVPEDATDENPLGEQRTDSPFSARKNGKQQTEAERAADVEKNKVDDIGLVDAVIGEKIRKSFERIAKMMGAKIQYQRTDKLGNGWIQESKDADGNVHRTIFITLDSSITEGAQFIFGHEMTHQIKNLNPAAYNELTQLVLDTYGSDAFDKAVDETMQRYSDAGFSGRARDYYAEEVVADAVGEMIRDLNLAHTLAMKMSHPLLAAIHEILQKIKLAFFGTEYSDVTKNIIRSIEQAYVKTANGQATNSETGEDVSFSLRQKPEPKKKGVGYKVFVLKDGKLYPPMVANPDGAATPVGVWLDADAAPIAGESKTGRPQVKQGGKGTQGGSGKLAYRPGWHLGVVPYAIQFNRKDAEGNKTLFPKNFVFAEVEYAADVDYQEEARQEGINPSGKYQHSLAGLKHLPTDGYYMYRTNPNPETDPWVITGAMKVNRILTRAEQAELVKNAGREPQQIQEGDIVTDDVVNSINQEIANAPKFSLKVYHGSGADFTEFDFDHMGEGAGSQVFGWGGYVTSSKKIGKSYANLVDANAPHQDVEYVGNNAHEYTDVVAGLFNGGQRDYDDVKEFLQNGYNSDKENARKKQMLEWFESTKPSDWKSVNDGKRNLYEVDIPEDNGSNYLEWEKKPSDEVATKIIEGLYGLDAKTLDDMASKDIVFRTLLYDYIKNADKEQMIPLLVKTHALTRETTYDNGNVEDDIRFVYNRLSRWMGSPKAASQFLSSLGFTGIKYPAGTIMGGAEENDTNYVIFKPEDMRITEHTKFSIKTYHGSQASFDKFDHSFMGSGEGAQAYGWGTYVSEVEGIAKAYAKANAKKNAPSRLMYQGKPMTYKTPSIIYQVALDMDKFNISAKESISKMIDADEKKLASVGDTPFAKMKAKQVQDELKVLKDLNPSDFKINEDYDTVVQDLVDTKSGLDLLEDELKDAKSYVDLYQSRLDEAKEELSKAKESGTGLGVDMYESDVEYYSEQVKRYKQSIKTKESDIKDVKTKVDALQKKLDSMEKPRNLYSVDIPDDTGDNYIGWDEPLTDKQVEMWKNAANSLAPKDDDGGWKERVDYYARRYGYNFRGEKAYKLLTSERTPKEVSLALKDAGFDGVKVIAQRNAGGNKEGKMNYVIFDENNAKITSHTKFSLKDNQGNPLNQDGTLKLDKIKSVDELTDEDFLHPTRNVELPSLPKKIADAIGTEGKPVVIKKNIFERNYMRHKDVTPELSKVIFKSALYNPDLYGQNQKKTRPYNWVLINTKDEKGNNRTVLLEVNPNKDNVEIVHWHFVNDKNLGLIKKQAIREGDQVLILPSEQSEEVGGLSNLTDDLSAAKIDNSSETAKENGEKFSLKDEKIKSVAEKFGVNEDDVAMYANAVERGSTAEAARARANIKRYLLQANEDKISSFKDIIKYTKPINEALKENFGDLDAMIEERRKQVEAQRNAMEAARKRAQEEEEKRQKHLDELSLIPTDELDKRYMDAIANNDESTAREMLDESARRNGYGDVDSDYQGQGAWAAPSNPQYESDEARRADIENSPDVNLEDIALGYNLQPDDYFDNPRAYMNNTAYGLESAHVIKNALDAIKNGEKDVKVKVYRAVPTSVKEGKLRNGDWVTPSKKYAEMHGDNRLEGKYRIIEDEVPSNQLWWDGNDANEFGFDDGREYRYKNAKNNRKLNDLITYDNKGNVIPPSKRFNSRKNDIRFSLAGERGAAAADKAEERTARMDNLSVARKMEEEKKDAKAIKMATGWERGADGKWRYEMPDAMIKDTMDVGGGHIVKRYEDDMLWNGGKLSKVIDAPELFKAYPQLKDVRIETDAIMNDMPSNGEYNAKTNTITIHADELKYMNSILNHEIQHVIQSIEGFGKGGSPEQMEKEFKAAQDEWKARAYAHELEEKTKEMGGEYNQSEVEKALVEEYKDLDMSDELPDKETRIKGFNYFARGYADRSMDDAIKRFRLNESTRADFDSYKEYLKLSGEVESRNVEKRLGMTDEERRKSLAESTEDVARKDQIFLGVGDVSFSLRGSTPYDKQMEEWMEKNHLEKGAVPMEKPIMKEGENIFDYANRMVEWTRNQNLWKTAPKKAGFQDALDKWKADNGLSPDAYPPVRPHRENYSTEIGYAEDLEEYNKKKELWKSAPKPKDFDLSVDLEDMNKQLRNIRRAVLNQKNYDQRTVKAVSNLVRKMLNIGWGDGLSRGKVGNLLSAAKNATGANDVKKYLDKAMGILAENYLNRLSTAYDNLINTRGARADQSGVIKMGSLDAKGQAFMSEYKKAMNMDDSSLNTYIANIEEGSAKNEDNVEMNDYRLAGIQAAIMYKQQIGGNDADISELKRQIGELKNKKDANKVDKDLLKSLEKKLFENMFDRITMFENLLNNIQRMVKESKGRAKEFREEITEHKNEILHRANLDLEGVDSTYYDTTTAKKKFVNNDLQRAVFSSTYTFEQFLKFFGKKAANGEGYLYNYFTKLNQDALDEEQLFNEMNRNALDEKTKELFGKEKFMKLVGIDGKGMKEMDVEVTDYSNKETGKRTVHLKQGQMLYIYLVNKETDGEMKLRAMGITEEDVAAIEENLDPRVKAMGEWLQDEYLPECQRRYQATHTKYFGAPMKEVENYFPLAINNRARNVKEDVNQDSDAMSQLAGTSTGAIVTRRVNVIPLDIENADAFEVAFNHLQEMEEWSAMLPFRQDINTLLSYTHFRNQVQNMSSVAYGSGKTLWDEFKQTAQIAAGTYKPKVNAGMMDSRIAAAMGGIAVAKISGRLWTAIKQSQSATVFLPECDFTRFVKNVVNPYGSWKWAMENIPDFRKRVENMTYGDVKLRQYLDELEKWHDWTKVISKWGMKANILVDAVTCAVGARSVYETEVNRLTKLGYPKEKAEEKAYYKAVAAYNKTQQSSGGMYLSPMQVDRTYVSAALSLFKNANYAYGRMQIEACRGLARTYDLWGGKHKTTLIESMTRQIMEEDGLDENTARAIAKATYNRTFRQSIGRLINFATLVPVSWALYKVLPYLLTGDDDDKKNDMIEEAVLKGFATSLSDNYVIPFASNILNAGLKVEDGKPTFDSEVFRYQNLYINPATSDLANIYSMIGNQKWYSVCNKVGMLGVQTLIGFNPETVGALYQAFAEADYDNGNTAKEWQIGILKAISAPEESIRELYMDELGLKSGDKDAMKKFMSLAGLDADDINKVPLAELEKRYAERQINRDNLLSQVFMDAEDFNGYVDKYQKSFEKKIKDKMDKWDEYDKKKTDEFFDTTSDPKLKDMIAKKRANDANAAADEQIAKEGLNQEKKGKEPSEEAYDAVKMSIDVAEDNAISTYNKVLNKRYAALNDEYNNQTDAMKYIFMSKHPNFKAYKDLKSEYTTYGKKIKELKEKLVSADGYDAKQTILKQIRAERDKFYELQSKVR